MTATKTDPETAPQSDAEDADGAILNLEEYVSPDRPVIMFRTEEEREKGIESKAYELRLPEEFGIVEEQSVRSESREFMELRNANGQLNKKQKSVLEQRIHHLFDKLLIAPDDIKAKFTDHQRQQVILLFTTALYTGDSQAVQSALPMIERIQARNGLSTTES